MKVFRKMFAFAVTVAAIAMATSAFAATAVYDDADTNNPLVKVTDGEFTEQAQMTVAVVPTNFGEEGTDAEDIYYIDQDEASVIIADLQSGLKIKDEIADRTGYQVRVAGTNTAMQTINFEAIEPDEDEYEILGGNEAGQTSQAVGIKGTFSLNAVVDTVYITVEDAVANRTAVIDWDLSEFNTNADIIFGLEIQSNEPRDLSGISIIGVSVTEPQPQV